MRKQWISPRRCLGSYPTPWCRRNNTPRGSSSLAEKLSSAVVAKRSKRKLSQKCPIEAKSVIHQRTSKITQHTVCEATKRGSYGCSGGCGYRTKVEEEHRRRAQQEVERQRRRQDEEEIKMEGECMKKKRDAEELRKRSAEKQAVDLRRHQQAQWKPKHQQQQARQHQQVEEDQRRQQQAAEERRRQEGEAFRRRQQHQPQMGQHQDAWQQDQQQERQKQQQDQQQKQHWQQSQPGFQKNSNAPGAGPHYRQAPPAQRPSPVNPKYTKKAHKTDDLSAVSKRRVTSVSNLSKPLKVLATYKLHATLSLVLVRGSVLDFAAPPPAVLIGVKDDAMHASQLPMPPLAAIVNAANPGCIGGGGIDGAISAAGGANLDRDRHQLLILSRSSNKNKKDYSKVRCLVGGAVVTGPGDYGSLKVPYVIHAVGPNYRDYENNEIYWENGKDQKESFNLDSVHALLKSAYQAALDRAVAHKIKHVAFCLLSAGVFRGSQSLETVLKIGMTGILEWSQAHGKKTATGKKCLSQIVMCAFTEQECWTLKKVCDDML